jgi:hypothetical protein
MGEGLGSGAQSDEPIIDWRRKDEEVFKLMRLLGTIREVLGEK